MRLIRVLLFAAMTLQAFAVLAAAPTFERTILQYTHERWSEESDVPRPVVAMAQDRRGYLWLATGAGVFRFDGDRFERMDPAVDLLRHGQPSALLARRNGEVWISYERSGRFAVYRDGQLRFPDAPTAPHRVAAMKEARDGTVWVLTEQIGLPLMRFREGRWISFGREAGAPRDNPFSMVVAQDGAVWVSFTGSVARLAAEGGRFEFVRREKGALGRLSMDPQGRIWVTERRGSYPITGPEGRGRPPPLRHAYATDDGEIRGRPMFDREGNLWIATYYDGLERVAHPDPRGAASPQDAVASVEHFTSRDGLTANVTSRLFQDAEGNVWVATEGGLDRFWPATLRYEPALTDPAAFGDLLLRASDGSVYIGEASTVYRVQPGGRPQQILRTQVEPRTLCEAPDGALWIGTNDGKIVIWRNGKLSRLAQDVPVSDTIYDCAFDRRGDYWVTAALGGMARYRDGRWERMFGPTGDAFRPKSMVTDAQGRIIVHWNDGLLSRLDGSTRHSVPIAFGRDGPSDMALYPIGPDTIFLAGRFGLARLEGDGVHILSANQMPLLSGVNGMAHTPDGELWLAGPGGILRTTLAEVERAFDDPDQLPTVEVFGPADGLRSRPHDHSRRSIVRGGDGRLWIATQTGTLWLDPAGLSRSQAPPSLAVSALSADKVYHDPTRITLPAGTSAIGLDFAVLAYSDPRGVRVRYRLEGQDRAWVDAGDRRQAFYTNLAPGTYRFRLMAANASGVWNEEGATVELVIPPTFVQSWWFVALCGVLALMLLWLAYRLHMARVAARIKSRLEERLGERERIARELHDTLLQGVQGLVLRFQSVANKMPSEGPSRAHLEAALKRADEIIAEGRDRVQDLRTTNGAVDLPELFREQAVGAGFDPAIPIRIVVEGKPRAVHSLIALELDRIAGEALFNIARHASAGSVEIMIRFGAWHLTVEIRDDGVGFAEDGVEKGRNPGHFGLIGMRERAERIGGSLAIDSGPGMGCTVTLTLPARLAFVDPPTRRPLSGWLSSLFARRRRPERV